MDPVVLASVITIGGGLILGAFQLRSTKGQASQTGADEFRGDLLTRITQQDTKIEAQDAKIERQAEKIEAQGKQIQEQHQEIADLRDELADRDAHLVVITDWGMHSTEPTPRNPPPWRHAT